MEVHKDDSAMGGVRCPACRPQIAFVAVGLLAAVVLFLSAENVGIFHSREGAALPVPRRMHGHSIVEPLTRQ